jgi:hypothetical protein
MYLSRNPNEGPHEVPVEWTEFDPARQNYLLEAPTFSVEEFDSATIADYDYWTNFPNYAEFPPDPSFPLMIDDEIDPEYYFNDLSDRYRLTEEGKLVNLHICAVQATHYVQYCLIVLGLFGLRVNLLRNFVNIF